MKTNLTRSQASRRAFTLVETHRGLDDSRGIGRYFDSAITDMVNRTSRSAASSNISEVSGRFSDMRPIPGLSRQPGQLDGGSERNAGYSGSLHAALTGQLVDVQLTANTLGTLQAAGIAHVGVHATMLAHSS